MLELIAICLIVAFAAGMIGFCLGTHFVPKELLSILEAEKKAADDMASKAAAEKDAAELVLKQKQEQYDELHKCILVWFKYSSTDKANVAWNLIDNFFAMNKDKYVQESFKRSFEDYVYTLKLSYRTLDKSIPPIDFTKLIPNAFH